MRLLHNILLCILIVVSINAQEINKGNLPGWKLIWSDEFNYQGLPDSNKWNYDVGAQGWGNHEKQYYSERRLENARVEDGKLIIEARKDSFNAPYSSARLVTHNKGDWTYGRFEIRAKLPQGVGTWPAIWMLPTKWTYGDGGWPDNGEIDIMEHVGFRPTYIHASAHTRSYYWRINTQKTDTIIIPTAMSDFHNYILEWFPDSLRIFVDDANYFSFKNEGTGWKEWPFDKDFHLVLNIAIGGDWGGIMGIDDSIFPQKMEVEYVRVYKKE